MSSANTVETSSISESIKYFIILFQIARIGTELAL